MHRMHHLAAALALGISLAASNSSEAPASLLRPTDTSTFPVAPSGSVGGTSRYTTSTGLLAIENTPRTLASGASAGPGTDVTADPAGERSRMLVAQLNADGSVNPNGANLYALNDSVTVDGTVYGGHSLQGGPPSMGPLDLATARPNVRGAALSDFDVRVTGGKFAQAYGPDALIRVEAERWSMFHSGFTADFSGGRVVREVRGGLAIAPSPVPEPSTLVVLIACGGVGLLVRRRRRIGLDELERTDGGASHPLGRPRQSARKVAESLPRASFSI